MSFRQCGFTLLELLVALAIFALLGIATYRMLEAVLRTDEVTRVHERELRELTRAIASLDRDFMQVVARPELGINGSLRPALLSDADADHSHASVEFTRGGWSNPLGLQRSELQRVRWRLVGEALERVYWPVLKAAGGEPRVQKVLEHVTELQLRYLDEHGTWQATWPPTSQKGKTADNPQLLPAAVEVELEVRRFGSLSRVYRLPENQPSPAAVQASEPKSWPHQQGDGQ